MPARTIYRVEGTNFTALTMSNLRQQLRECYGARRYRIVDGDEGPEVHYWGNVIDEHDRSHDYWQLAGNLIEERLQALTVSEAAKAAGITRQSLLERISSDRLPARKIGGTWLVERKDLEAYRPAKPGPKS